MLRPAPPTTAQPPADDPRAGLGSAIRIGRPERTGACVDVLDPWSGATLARLPAAGRADIDAAVRAARRYLSSPMPDLDRADVLERFAALMLERGDELAATLSTEGGKPIVDARAEIHRCAATIDVYADAARELNRASREDLDRLADAPGAVAAGRVGEAMDSCRVITQWRPVGVVLAYSPFNFPANTVAHKLGAGIAAGCAVLLKPSDKTPLTALGLGALLDEAGAAEGMAQVLIGPPAAFDHLIEDPAIDAFTMTGHSDVGRMLGSRFLAAHPFGRCHLELGGQGAQLCLPDVPAAEAAALVAEALWRHNGARCTTPRKILVPETSWGDDFVDALTALAVHYPAGDPSDEDMRIGPMIDDVAAEAVGIRIDDALAHGARLRAGTVSGRTVTATVIDGVRPGMALFDEENFGPVASVLRYRDLDHAVELANAGDYGLQPAVLTDDLALGAALGQRLRAGTLNIGRATTADRSDRVPFGGVGASGIGKEGGLAGVRELCHEVPMKLFTGL